LAKDDRVEMGRPGGGAEEGGEGFHFILTLLKKMRRYLNPCKKDVNPF
jgi:hypothetical protein